MDVIFQLGAPPGGAVDGPPAAWVVGAMLGPADIRYEGPADVLGVRFRPGAARAWVAPPADALVDQVVDLATLWRDVPALIDELGSAGDDAARIGHFQRRLIERMRRGVGADPAAVVLERSGGAMAVADLVRATGIGERQLQRRFREAIGYPPRTARRIARFKRAARILSHAPATPWPELVHACGFHDQPHLIREFRAFAGMTPAAFAIARDVGSVQDDGASTLHIEDRQPTGERRRSA